MGLSGFVGLGDAVQFLSRLKRLLAAFQDLANDVLSCRRIDRPTITHDGELACTTKRDDQLGVAKDDDICIVGHDDLAMEQRTNKMTIRFNDEGRTEAIGKMQQDDAELSAFIRSQIPPMTALRIIRCRLLLRTRGNSNVPKCGATVKLRTAKQGTNASSQFWECSNYPACTTTRPLAIR